MKIGLPHTILPLFAFMLSGLSGLSGVSAQELFRDKIEAGPHVVLPLLGEGDGGELGFGVHADYHWNPRLSTELSYSTFDDTVGLGTLGPVDGGRANLDVDLWTFSAKYNIWSMNRSKRLQLYRPAPRFRDGDMTSTASGVKYNVDGRDDFYSESENIHYDQSEGRRFENHAMRHAGESSDAVDHHGRPITTRYEDWDDLDLSHENDANIFIGLGLSYLNADADIGNLDSTLTSLDGDIRDAEVDIDARLGWHFMFGADYGFTEHWEVFADYRHIFVSNDLKASLNSIADGVGSSQNFERSLNYDVGLLRIGLNYRW